MSDPENFLSRWSRRKREASREAAAADAPATDATAQGDRAADEAASRSAPAAEPDFDPTSLPPIEEINAQTDVSAFLRAGVPADMARAALRRAWSSDPAIRDFIGLSENSWDFNAPDGMPGFGPIDPAEVARLVARLTGMTEADARADTAAPPADRPPPREPGQAVSTGDGPAMPAQQLRGQPLQGQGGDAAVAAQEITQRTKAPIAAPGPSEHDEERVTSSRSGHGGALPE
jgi:hypothetical protein